jgi:sterol desaturase/sphingolipid hydroxylase (fatty acid hydroxylase superfamily)
MRRALIIAVMVTAIAYLEHRRPLRARTQPTARRTAINVAMAGLTALCVAPIQQRIVGRAMEWAGRRRVGLQRHRMLPPWAARVLRFVLLDYTLWHWHRWNHRVPWLWAMHAAHHADLDLDVSTAARFHVGEMLASVPVRAAQAVVFGVDRATLRTWELAVVVAIAFHHSNLRLPARLEAVLGRFVITPRLHGIHHSARPDRLDTNYGTLFSIWDWIHDTRATDLEQRELAIGLPRTIGGTTPSLVDSLVLPLRPALAKK